LRDVGELDGTMMAIHQQESSKKLGRRGPEQGAKALIHNPLQNS